MKLQSGEYGIAIVVGYSPDCEAVSASSVQRQCIRQCTSGVTITVNRWINCFQPARRTRKVTLLDTWSRVSVP